MNHIAYLSLGSNVGDPEGHLHEAISRLEKQEGSITAVSSFYETEPVEVTDQPWFVNCAVKLVTSRNAAHLMSGILEIEGKMGRQRVREKGPRTIDIDIVLFDDALVNMPELVIPHPAMASRRFVLEPLAEIAPELLHPVLGKTVKDLLVGLPPGQIVRRRR